MNKRLKKVYEKWLTTIQRNNGISADQYEVFKITTNAELPKDDRLIITADNTIYYIKNIHNPDKLFIHKTMLKLLKQAGFISQSIVNLYYSDNWQQHVNKMFCGHAYKGIIYASESYNMDIVRGELESLFQKRENELKARYPHMKFNLLTNVDEVN